MAPFANMIVLYGADDAMICRMLDNFDCVHLSAHGGCGKGAQIGRGGADRGRVAEQARRLGGLNTSIIRTEPYIADFDCTFEQAIEAVCNRALLHCEPALSRFTSTCSRRMPTSPSSL